MVDLAALMGDVSRHLADLTTGLRVDPRSATSPGAFAKALDPTTVQTPALDLIDAALVDVAEGRCDRLMIAMPPQEGKSTRTSRWFTEWMLTRNPSLRVAIVSYAQWLARHWGQVIRNDISEHGDRLGLAVDPGTSAAHDWRLAGKRGSVYCVGIRGGLTGRAVDLLIIDDPYKDGEQADSDAWRETIRMWWTEVGLPRLGPGVPVVIIQTRWRQDDLSGWLQKDFADEWRVINIPAQADHDPDAGEVDPLGREPGEFLISALGRSAADWEKKKREVGSRAWLAEFQGRPTPGQGLTFQRHWWQRYDVPQWIERDDGSRLGLGFDEVCQSWDMAFKDLSDSDFVVGQVWGRRNVQAYLLDQVRGRYSFVDTCQQLRAVSARWPQATAKYVEDKANGTAVMNALRVTVPGMIAVEPEGSKLARALAVSPFVEGGNVHLPSSELCPWIGEFIEEAADFPLGAHDDQVDTASQALNRLLLSPILAGVVYEDEYEDEEFSGISRY